MQGILMTIDWVVDNLLSFTPQIVMLLGVGLAVAIWRKAVGWIMVCLMGIGVGWGSMALATLNHAPVQDPDKVTATATIRMLTFDLRAANRKYTEVLDYIWDSDADMVCLQEAGSEGWRTAVGSLLRVYRHGFMSAQGGTVLLSKTPFDQKTGVDVGAATPRTIGVVSKAFGQPIDIYCTHLSPAGNPMDRSARNVELGHLARDIFRSNNPVVVLGNLNASSRSPAMFRFLQHTDLKTADPGFPPANSWPASMPVLGLRLDHVLVSQPFMITRRRTGPALGSNHRPMHVDLALPAPDSEASRDAIAAIRPAP